LLRALCLFRLQLNSDTGWQRLAPLSDNPCPKINSAAQRPDKRIEKSASAPCWAQSFQRLDLWPMQGPAQELSLLLTSACADSVCVPVSARPLDNYMSEQEHVALSLCFTFLIKTLSTEASAATISLGDMCKTLQQKNESKTKCHHDHPAPFSKIRVKKKTVWKGFVRSRKKRTTTGAGPPPSRPVG